MSICSKKEKQKKKKKKKSKTQFFITTFMVVVVIVTVSIYVDSVLFHKLKNQQKKNLSISIYSNSYSSTNHFNKKKIKKY